MDDRAISCFDGDLTPFACDVLNVVARNCYTIASEHGFHEGQENIGEKIALIHSELSEALEALRKPQTSDHLENRTLFEEELADVVIRVFDLAGQCGLRIGNVIIEKMLFNNKRPFMHGKKF